MEHLSEFRQRDTNKTVEVLGLTSDEFSDDGIECHLFSSHVPTCSVQRLRLFAHPCRINDGDIQCHKTGKSKIYIAESAFFRNDTERPVAYGVERQRQ